MTQSTFTAKTFLGTKRGHFDGYESGDPVSNGPEVQVTIRFPAEDLVAAGKSAVDQALDMIWIVGNRETLHDATLSDGSKDWPRTVRSLSKGDLIVLEGIGAFAIEGVGFRPISRLALVRSILAESESYLNLPPAPDGLPRVEANRQEDSLAARHFLHGIPVTIVTLGNRRATVVRLNGGTGQSIPGRAVEVYRSEIETRWLRRSEWLKAIEKAREDAVPASNW